MGGMGGRWGVGDGGELMSSRTITMKMVMVAVVVGLPGCCVHGLDRLHVPSDRLDVVAGEHARLAIAASFPPVGVRVVQDLDEFATSETELSLLLWVKVKEGLHVCRVLRDLEEEQENRHRFSESVMKLKA